jgi:hypothetical protein
LCGEAKHTAKFVELIDSLFDSLNSFSKAAEDGKALGCAVSDESPHENFWIELLPKNNKWKLISKKKQVRMLLISINLLQGGK